MRGIILRNLFLDIVAFDIAKFLHLSKAEIAQRSAGKIKLFFEKLTHQNVKGNMPSFERYTII